MTVPKHARRLDGLTAQVVSLYEGHDHGDIQAHLVEMYDTEISRETPPSSPIAASYTRRRLRD